MAHLFRPTLVLCIALMSVAGHAQQPPASTSDPEAIRQREQQRVAALVAGDVDRVAAMLSPTLSYTHSNATLESKDAFLANLRAGQVVYRSLTHKDVQVRVVAPDVAVMNGLSDVVVAIGGKEQTVPLRFTMVYVRQGGEWLLEVWHSTRRPE
jgi:uncharacterized protein (TIGR02246 family)